MQPAETVLVARSKDRLEAVKQEIEDLGGRARSYPADLSDATAVAQLVREIRAGFSAYLGSKPAFE